MSVAYQLNLQISADDLKTLHDAKENINISKSVTGGNGQGLSVVWLNWKASVVIFNLKPFEGNDVNWTEVYGLYASDTLLQAGATIHRESDVKKVNPGYLYTFDESGTFDSGTTTGGKPGWFSVSNQWTDDKELTYGVTQEATINGRKIDSVLNAVVVPK
jgi:hypothetical protein